MPSIPSDRIGCSEIAAAIGISPWKTPYRLWEEKIGSSPEFNGNRLAMALGEPMEAVIVPFVEEQRRTRYRRTNKVWKHPALPLIGHPDRLAVGVKEGLEIKTALSFSARDKWGKDSDEIPMHYLCQVQGYLMLTGFPVWIVAVLMAGPELRLYTIRPHAELQDLIADEIADFWRNVETNTPPEPITLDDVNRRWSVAKDGMELADAVTSANVAELAKIKEKVRYLEKQADDLEMQIKARIATSPGLIDVDGNTLCTWKNQTATRLDTNALKTECPDVYARFAKETNSRIFRLKKEKS